MHQFSDYSCQREDLQFLAAAPPLRGTLVALPSLAHVRWCTVALEQTYRHKTSRQSRSSSFIIEPLKRHCSSVGSHHHRNRFFFPHGGSKSSSAFSIGLTMAILNVCLQHTKCHFTIYRPFWWLLWWRCLPRFRDGFFLIAAKVTESKNTSCHTQGRLLSTTNF